MRILIRFCWDSNWNENTQSSVRAVRREEKERKRLGKYFSIFNSIDLGMKFFSTAYTKSHFLSLSPIIVVFTFTCFLKRLFKAQSSSEREVRCHQIFGIIFNDEEWDSMNEKKKARDTVKVCEASLREKIDNRKSHLSKSFLNFPSKGTKNISQERNKKKFEISCEVQIDNNFTLQFLNFLFIVLFIFDESNCLHWF